MIKTVQITIVPVYSTMYHVHGRGHPWSVMK